MARPLIGITTGHLPGEGSRECRSAVQRIVVGCARAYVTEVVRAGGSALLMPPVAERDAVRAMIEGLDALLLSGGGDVAALEFDAEPHPSIRNVDVPRDRLEIEATRLAARRGLPILAICRGVQVLNIALGGDIIQDISTQIDGAIQHWSCELVPGPSHTIEVEAPSRLASLIGAGRVAVNSGHHQAVGRLAKGLRATARSPDGVIEAIEAADGRPILGVQFHPEQLADDYAQFRAIFDWFVAQARRFRRSRRKR